MLSSVRLTLLALLLTGVFLSLGQWQLQRAAFKQQMIALFEAGQQVKPLPWSQEMEEPTPYQRIELEGYYLPGVFLLDNQYANHHWGYHVLSALRLSDGNVVIVNRGWVSGGERRDVLPQITTPKTLQKVSGHAYYPRHNRMIGQVPFQRLAKEVWLMAEFDKEKLQQLMHQSVLPFMLRLDKAAPEGFLRDWQIVSMPPARHKGYALQWFSLAFLVVVGWAALLWRSLVPVGLGMTSWRIPLILTVVFLFPGLSAYWCFYHRDNLMTHKTNRGHWVMPQTHLPLETHHKWQLIYVAPDFSLKSLEQLAKIRLALGRQVYRIELKWITQQAITAEQAVLLQQMDIQPVALKKVPQALKHQAICLVSPEGLAVLSYENDRDPKAVYLDLKKLVTSS